MKITSNKAKADMSEDIKSKNFCVSKYCGNTSQKMRM